MKNLFKPQIIKVFTHDVKNYLQGAQLQGFKAWKTEGGAWIYELRFFPGPKKGILLGWHPDVREWAWSLLETIEEVACAKGGLGAAQDPVQLFVKAHALNKRVESFLFNEASGGRAENLELKIQTGVSVVWERENSHGPRVRVVVKREGQKDFSRSLELGTLRAAPLPTTAISEEGVPAEALGTAVRPRLLTKADKLVEKVQGDVDASRRGLAELQRLCAFLETDPQAWGREAWPDEVRQSLAWVRAETRLPAFHGPNRGEALAIIHDLRRRYQRKLGGSQKRLVEVIGKLGAAAAGEPSAGISSPKPSTAPRSPETKAQATGKALGQWVEHPTGLRARLGKSARENAQLFREAGSKDLWFHIRGLGGAHVWVPRGQALFGAKDASLRDDLELWACQLAIYNSKARHSNYGVVDIAEKRHLKSAKGQEGTLLIARSETRMADLDDAFQKWIRG